VAIQLFFFFFPPKRQQPNRTNENRRKGKGKKEESNHSSLGGGLGLKLGLAEVVLLGKEIPGGLANVAELGRRHDFCKEPKSVEMSLSS